jgi:putative hydrolase of the HAD superfamily
MGGACCLLKADLQTGAKIRKAARADFKNIQAITFDVGGTLLQPWPSVGHVYASIAAEHGHQGVAPELLNRQFAAAWRARKSFDHSRSAWLQLAQKAFFGTLDEARVKDLFDDLYDRFAAIEAWRVFDDVPPALDLLRKHQFPLAVISNWDERLRPLLTGLQLRDFFEVILISVEAGFAKPATEIFHKAAQRLGVAPDSIVHVGDSPSEDVAGAEGAGFRAILLDRTFAESQWPSISTLVGLKGLLEID